MKSLLWRALRAPLALLIGVWRRLGRQARRLLVRIETATVLAAIAALFSATAAVIALTIQEQIGTNAIRPELNLTEWRTEYNEKGGEIHIGMIENVGQGPAFGIRRYLRVPGNEKPFCAFLPSEPLMILPRGARLPIDWHGRFLWECGTDGQNVVVPLRLVIYYYDLNENLHTRVLHLGVTKSGQWVANTQLLAQALSWYHTCTEIRGHHFWNKIFPLSRSTCRD